ncbi:hypothetical protein ACPCUF_34200 [Streptomyces griseoincarnatus]
MPRRRPQPPVRYAVIGHEGAHHVVDQLHGYALSSHTTRPAAEDAARELACNPTAAIAAAEALDAAQSGPAATERRILRRYGYAWSLRQDEMLSLMREFSHRRLETLVSNGHLSTVFTPAGQPYYTTPERFDELSPRWVRDGDESFPAAQPARLERPRPALGRCLLCGPREVPVGRVHRQPRNGVLRAVRAARPPAQLPAAAAPGPRIEQSSRSGAGSHLP